MHYSFLIHNGPPAAPQLRGCRALPRKTDRGERGSEDKLAAEAKNRRRRRAKRAAARRQHLRPPLPTKAALGHPQTPLGPLKSGVQATSRCSSAKAGISVRAHLDKPLDTKGEKGYMETPEACSMQCNISPLKSVLV